jgi:hypothetical protein
LHKTDCPMVAQSRQVSRLVYEPLV